MTQGARFLPSSGPARSPTQSSPWATNSCTARPSEGRSKGRKSASSPETFGERVSPSSPLPSGAWYGGTGLSPERTGASVPSSPAEPSVTTTAGGESAPGRRTRPASPARAGSSARRVALSASGTPGATTPLASAPGPATSEADPGAATGGTPPGAAGVTTRFASALGAGRAEAIPGAATQPGPTSAAVTPGATPRLTS